MRKDLDLGDTGGHIQTQDELLGVLAETGGLPPAGVWRVVEELPGGVLGVLAGTTMDGEAHLGDVRHGTVGGEAVHGATWGRDVRGRSEGRREGAGRVPGGAG